MQVFPRMCVALTPFLVFGSILLLSGSYEAILASWTPRQSLFFPSFFPVTYEADLRIGACIHLEARDMPTGSFWMNCTMLAVGKESAGAMPDALLCPVSRFGGAPYWVAKFNRHGDPFTEMTAEGLAQAYRWRDSLRFQSMFQTFNPSATPYDCYKSPMLVVGLYGNVTFEGVDLNYEMPSGYIASLRSLSEDVLTREELQQLLTSRTGATLWELGLDEIIQRFEKYYCFDFIVIRRFDQMIMLSLYMISALYLLFVCSFLTVLRLPSLESRLRVYSGVVLALFGFVWSFRQVLPGAMTYWEGGLISWILVWSMFELVREMRR